LSQQSVQVSTILITLACLAIFALAPEIDVDVALLFFRDGHFGGGSPVGDFWRRIFWDAPYVTLAGMIGAFVLRRTGRIKRGPDARAVVFLILSLALGPGLLVNGLLKEHTGRPRPEFTEYFGGPWAFRPYYDFSGDCPTNCSFASGEASTAAWTLAPALLAPPALRPYAVAAALLLTLATSLLRMIFGGHYLSDVTLAALFTFLIVLGGYRWYSRGSATFL
jgi:membrane-associated phospholipid phosphatase